MTRGWLEGPAAPNPCQHKGSEDARLPGGARRPQPKLGARPALLPARAIMRQPAPAGSYASWCLRCGSAVSTVSGRAATAVLSRANALSPSINTRCRTRRLVSSAAGVAEIRPEGACSKGVSDLPSPEPAPPRVFGRPGRTTRAVRCNNPRICGFLRLMALLRKRGENRSQSARRPPRDSCCRAAISGRLRRGCVSSPTLPAAVTARGTSATSVWAHPSTPAAELIG